MLINPFSHNFPKVMIQTGISATNTTDSIVRVQKIPIFSNTGLPHNKVASQVARQVSLVQIKDTQDTHKENFATFFGVTRVNTETVHFFCSDCMESREMQQTAPFLNLVRERIKDGPVSQAVIV